jgi:hypothetical protein
MNTKIGNLDAELNAVKTIYEALFPLDTSGRAFVLTTVSSRLQVSPTSSREISGNTHHETPTSAITLAKPQIPQSGTEITSKEFLKQKAPITDVQRIACLAYYLTRHRNQPQFKTKDLTKLNSEAKQPQMSNPSMTVMNATRQNEFLAPLPGGFRQITAFGEEIVDALPDQDAVKKLFGARRKPRKRNAKNGNVKSK